MTDGFVITIPPTMPVAGVFRGKQAFRELIPLVAATVAVAKMEFVATTVGDDHVVEIVEFTLIGADAPVQVAEVNRFRGDQICEIRTFYPDPPLGSLPPNAAGRPEPCCPDGVSPPYDGPVVMALGGALDYPGWNPQSAEIWASHGPFRAQRYAGSRTARDQPLREPADPFDLRAEHIAVDEETRRLHAGADAWRGAGENQVAG